MKNDNTTSITGTFEHLIYSPPGNIEGFLLSVDGQPVQIVFEAFQPKVYNPLVSLAKGQQVSLEASASSALEEGRGLAPPVYDLIQLVSLDNREVGDAGDAAGPAYTGKVVRLNYARHGEPNGVVLDSGDFIHTKPKGFAQLKLKIGSKVEADGDAHMLGTNTGWARRKRGLSTASTWLIGMSATMTTAAAPSSEPNMPDDKRSSIRWLKYLNFSIADVQNGMGPYVALFLQSAAQWNSAQIGTALAFGNLAQVLAQTPAGALIDQLRRKRTLLFIGIGMIALACIVTPIWPRLFVVTGAQVLIGVAGAFFPPTLAAIALGLVGRKRMDAQMGTNQAFNAAGNVFAAVAIGAIGYFVSLAGMFFLVVALCLVSWFFVSRIRSEDIDYELARGADGEGAEAAGRQREEGVAAGVRDLLAGFRELLRQKPVRVFLVCAVLFHFANAAMVPLVTQMLARDQGPQTAVLLTSGYMLASQLVFVVVAAMSGRLASRWGRKPLFMFAFAALAARGVLYTLSKEPAALIAVQCMDGLGAGVFGVVGVLIIADLTKGTGRFNAAQGAVATAQGIGAF